MSSTEAQRPAHATPAPADVAAEASSSGEDTQLQSLLDSVDRTAAAAEASLEEARAIAAEELTERVEAGRQAAAAAAPDLASQLDSLLDKVEPAQTAESPAPTATEPDATNEPAGSQDLAQQLDSLLDQAEATSPTPQAADATAAPQANDASGETPAAEPTDATPASTDDIAAALDALDGGGTPPVKAEPDAEHMTDEVAAAASSGDAAASAAVATTPESEAPASAPGTMVPPNATPPAPAAMTKVEADPNVTPPGPAPMLKVPSEEPATVTPVAGPSFTRRVGTALMKPVEKFHAGANAVEAVTLKALSPLGRPMATASRGVRLAVGGFALYSAALGVGAAYYAVFVRPTTFYQTRATPFSLKEGALPASPHGDAGGHGAAASDGGHGKADKKEDAGHGDGKADAKSKSSSKQPPKKKEADKKSTAKKGADKKGSDKKAQGGH